jgi:uncharacterized protein (DUF3820 family)
VRTWREYKLKFGKYQGKTLGYVRVVDFQYCLWLEENINPPIKEVGEMMEYIAKVDPCSLTYHNVPLNKREVCTQ